MCHINFCFQISIVVVPSICMPSVCMLDSAVNTGEVPILGYDFKYYVTVASVSCK